jgi:hypothetical protein
VQGQVIGLLNSHPLRVRDGIAISHPADANLMERQHSLPLIQRRTETGVGFRAAGWGAAVRLHP